MYILKFFKKVIILIFIFSLINNFYIDSAFANIFKIKPKTSKSKEVNKTKKEIKVNENKENENIDRFENNVDEAKNLDNKQFGSTVLVSKTDYDENGIAIERYKFLKKTGDVPVHVLRVDLNRNILIPKIVLAEQNKLGSRGTLLEICERYGAVAGVNGSFFDAKTYAAIGYLMIDGKPIQAPLVVKARTTFGITYDNKVMIGKPKFRRRIRPENGYFSIIDGINRKCEYGEIIIYTYEYAKKVTIPKGGVGFIVDENGVVTDIVSDGNISIPNEGALLVVTSEHLHRFQNVSIGTKIHFTQTLMSPWDKVRDAFGSGMLLVTDSKITFDQSREEVGKYLMGDAPRTAVGITKNNELLMVVCDGRSSKYRGVDFEELAQIMIDCGATDAIALDGGGSSTLVYKNQVLNTPSDKTGLRKIANALILLKR